MGRRFMEYIGGKLKSLYSYLDLPFSAVLVFFLPNGVNNGR
jgi:uncharacterized protein YceK